MRHRVFIILALAVLLPVAAHAQGSRKDDIVLNRFGQPVAGASVTVCTSGATGTPCSPLASIFSDVGLTHPLANPLTSDGQGNYHFYAAPARYLIQISGAGVAATTIPDVLLPADPTSPSFQSLSVTQNISALNLNLAGNLSVSGGISSPTTLSAPQQGGAAPVQIGPHWYPGNATGLCAIPAAPAVVTETISSGTGNFSSATTYYVKVTLFNRNGQTTASPATAYTPASGSTNQMLVQLADYSYRSGCYGFRVWVSTTGVNGTYFPAQARTLPTVGFSSLTRKASGLVTAITSAAHGLVPGESITVSGVTGGTTSFNGTFTLIAQQGSSPSTLFWMQSGAAESANPSTGSGTVIAGLGADSFGHMSPGDFIVATVPTSGSAPPSTNTATIDPLQVALNSTCTYSPLACTGGQLVVPQGTQNLTTPLIVTGGQTVTGVNSPNAGGKSELSCAWKDSNLGCLTLLGIANGARVEGLDIESQGHGLMLTGWGPGFASSSILVRNNYINGGGGGINGLYAPIYIHGGTWYELGFEHNFLNGDLADVMADAFAGGWWFFTGSPGRWNGANLSGAGLSTNGFLSVSSVTDPDRAANRGSFPNGVSNVEISNVIYEGGTGVVFDAVNTGLSLRNVTTADSVAIAGTPALLRIGTDANSAGATNYDTHFENAVILGASGVSTGLQIIGSNANNFGPVSIINSTLGGNPNEIDYNNVSVEIVSIDSTVDPYEGASAHKIINLPATGQMPTVVGYYDTNGSHWLAGGIRFTPVTNTSADFYLVPATNFMNWYGGSPGVASNLFMQWGYSSGGRLLGYQNDGATLLWDFKATSGANQINLCNPSSPANSKVNLGCPLVDSTGATVKGALTGTSASLGGSALSAGACTSGTVSISGAATSMAVAVSPSADPGTGFSWMGFVSSSGTVTVRVCAIAAGTPTSTAYNVRVIQ